MSEMTTPVSTPIGSTPRRYPARVIDCAPVVLLSCVGRRAAVPPCIGCAAGERTRDFCTPVLQDLDHKSWLATGADARRGHAARPARSRRSPHAD